MSPPSRLRASGQAMAEMILAIPLLLLFAAGMFQFTQLFLARVAFEQACGSAAREWAAGLRSGSSIPAGIWAALGEDQRLFRRETLEVEPSPASSMLASFQAKNRAVLGSIGNWFKGRLFDYGGIRWKVSIRCRPVPLFRWLFDDGIPFSTRLAVLRHPENQGPAR